MAEAVACYRVGALRSSVVSAWTTAVLDIITKIRELELTGDGNARVFVEEIDKIVESNDVEASQVLERTILDTARNEFELLTDNEKTDLERLRQDRHRCAHPAMNRGDEPYQPTVEQVRYHLASVMTHLLIQPPVQGKAALKRLQDEVKSPLFPRDLDGALRVLSSGPLQRPRESLVRNFTVSTLKAVLRGENAVDRSFVERALAALRAVQQLHPQVTLRILQNDAAKLLNSLNDEELPRLLSIGKVFRELLDHVPQNVRVKLAELIGQVDVRAHPEVLLDAAEVGGIGNDITTRVATLGVDEITEIFSFSRTSAEKYRPLIARAVELLALSTSWATSNGLMDLVLIPSAAALLEADLRAIARAAEENVEVRQANRTIKLFAAVRDAGTLSPSLVLEILYGHDLVEKFRSLLVGFEPALIVQASGSAKELQVGLRVRHPSGIAKVVAMTEGDDQVVSLLFDDDLFPTTRKVLRAHVHLDYLDDVGG
jgi:hypothetical protein